jgi:HEAT repeat protein
LRRLAVSVCSVSPSQHVDSLRRLALEDPDSLVRAMAVEGLGNAGGGVIETLDAAAADEEGPVREAAATAYGELGDPAAVDWLLDRARRDDDRLVREAAVAALGAIGDDRAVSTLLELVADGPPRVRRRAVVALTVFDDPDIEPAIRRAAGDRNPGVREAAEMVVGRSSSVAE